MSEHQTADPDLDVLAVQVLFSVQCELSTVLAEQGFDDIQPRAGAVLAHPRADGIRASELARVSGQHKQVIGSLVDDLERDRAHDGDGGLHLEQPAFGGADQFGAAAPGGIDRRHRGRHRPVAHVRSRGLE
ncbi:hypothetical protein N4G69_24495 [Streptomyces mirabilis]|uniref:hypothetical protein n=1 Tax=Streptomyces mirabilis TaxID=68239 RepID=UPI0021BE3D04|nr:hypothetical protein [Streptomyces mirabilis]MCT9108741.1 hypothetical protein [Streptomyces mirabilis]